MTDSQFTFEVPEYNQAIVTRLLINYIDIRISLLDRMPKPNRPLYSTTKKLSYRERPLGSSTTTPWPFMTKARAASPIDGKKRARMMEDLHVATIDLENALKTLTNDEYRLIADYYIYGNGTLEELATARGLASKGRFHERLQRIVKKLVKRMNGYE